LRGRASVFHAHGDATCISSFGKVETHMIAEAPSPSCDTHATVFRRQQMRVARSHVRLCARARVTGVAFFDFDHGQTGVAPNAKELHPILGFRCLSG
jgi:hypothetical protein